MRRMVAKWLIILVCVLMVIAMLVCKLADNEAALFLITLAGLVVLSVLLWYLRCPGCGRLPGRGALFHEFCPYCGEMLDLE